MIISDKSDTDNNSAVNNYYSKTDGCEVIINGKLENRKCLTTRNDGDINIHISGGKFIISCEK